VEEEAVALRIFVLLLCLAFASSGFAQRPSEADGKRVEASTLRPGQVFRDCQDVCPEMVVLPAGEFIMGSRESDANRQPDEGRPQQKVTIAWPFAVGKFEVTFGEWDTCVEDGGCTCRPSDQGWGRGRRPVINVSWHDAKGYVVWLSRRTGRTYRLLSEAEWEYAVRAGTTTRYSSGDTISKTQAQFSAKKTVEVGLFPANRFGLHDLHGNVWEWVEDPWHPNYHGAPVDGSVSQGGDPSHGVLRGGCWVDFPDYLASAIRWGLRQDGRGNCTGFRVARTL
jgi:formylglycine-generating enzyme required for sulfatase activity